MFFLNIIGAYYIGLRNSCSIFRACLMNQQTCLPKSTACISWHIGNCISSSIFIIWYKIQYYLLTNNRICWCLLCSRTKKRCDIVPAIFWIFFSTKVWRVESYWICFRQICKFGSIPVRHCIQTLASSDFFNRPSIGLLSALIILRAELELFNFH